MPSTLYHYTDVGALKSIVEHSQIWATDARFLNDSQELTFGRSRMIEALRNLSSQLEAGEDLEQHRASIIRSGVGSLERPDDPAAAYNWATYVACFCAKGDLLSQWRGYAAGGGYALGFDKDILSRATVSAEYGPLAVGLTEVGYGNKALEVVIAATLPLVGLSLSAHKVVQGHYEAGRTLLPALASLKDEAFSEERETRLIFTAESFTPELRVGSFGLVPYVRIDVPTQALQSIVIGPGDNVELRAIGVHRLLQRLNIGDVEVVQSSLPFRG